MSLFARWLVFGFALTLAPTAFARAVVQDDFEFTSSDYGIPCRQFALAFANDSGGDFAELGSVDLNSKQVTVLFSTPEQCRAFRRIWRDARAALVKAAELGSTRHKIIANT